jgi:hypothetical protein
MAASATISGALSVGTFTVNSLSVGSGGITAAGATINGNLTATGNVGIGTATPTEKLEVAGNIKALAVLYAGGSEVDDAVIKNTLMAIGNVGIGTSPSAITKLNIAQSARTGTHPNSLGLYVTGDFNAQNNGIEFRHTNGTQGIGFGYNSIYATGSNTDQDLNLLPRGAGKVGIGTASPTEKLEVAGNIKVNGYYAAVGSEVLRIIRGTVTSTGAIDSGSGFTVSRTALGLYQITFNAVFSAKPTVVVTQQYPDSDIFVDAGGSTLDNSIVIAVSTSKCLVKCGQGAGNAADRRFEFIAIGPR